MTSRRDMLFTCMYAAAGRPPPLLILGPRGKVRRTSHGRPVPQRLPAVDSRGLPTSGRVLPQLAPLVYTPDAVNALKRSSDPRTAVDRMVLAADAHCPEVMARSNGAPSEAVETLLPGTQLLWRILSYHPRLLQTEVRSSYNPPALCRAPTDFGPQESSGRRCLRGHCRQQLIDCTVTPTSISHPIEQQQIGGLCKQWDRNSPSSHVAGPD